MKRLLQDRTILILGVCFLVGINTNVNAQCSGGTWGYEGILTPIQGWQLLSGVTGGKYYTFTAVAGTPYTFSYCQGGGSFLPGSNPQITVRNDLGVSVATNDNSCGNGAHINFWTPSVSGNYQVLFTESGCLPGTFANTVAYRAEQVPGTGNNCASPRLIPSLPFSETRLATCGRGNAFNNSLPPFSSYMNGEDMLFSFSGNALQCISILLSNTYANVGVFLYDGCPSTPGTNCLIYKTEATGNPNIIQYTLPATQTYYILVSKTFSLSLNCTPFDIDVVVCPPPASGIGSTCATPYVIPSIPFEGLGFTTQGAGNHYNSTMSCTSPYMDGEDYVFRYDATGPECIDIRLANAPTYVGLFVLNGCPDAGGVCMESIGNPGGNPFARNISLPGAGSYYIIIDTWPSPTYTNFSITIDHCTPACSLNVPGGDFCGTAPTLDPPIDSICGTTSPAPTFTADVPGNLGATFCGSIENNQWFRFTAVASQMTFIVHPSACSNNFGIQAQVLGSPDCNTFTSFSSCYSPVGPWAGSLVASGMTPGQTYYLMVDGYSGDECDFLITYSGLLPVELTNLDYSVSGSTVNLNWQTASEMNNLGFYVQRGNWFSSNERNSINWTDIGFVAGNGNSNETHNWTYSDQPTWTNSKNYYRIRQVDNNGLSNFSPVIEVQPAMNAETTLLEVYPNPATDRITVNYANAGSNSVQLSLLDFSGQEVRTWQFTEGAGTWSRDLDLGSLSSGMYFLRLKSGYSGVTQKLNISR